MSVWSGAVAERVDFHVYLAYAFLHSILIFPMVARWTWTDFGFLSAHRAPEYGGLLFGCGALDTAG